MQGTGQRQSDDATRVAARRAWGIRLRGGPNHIVQKEKGTWLFSAHTEHASPDWAKRLHNKKKIKKKCEYIYLEEEMFV